MISRLKKLRGRTAAELAERGRQKIATLAELAGVSADLREPSDEAFLSLFESQGLSNANEMLDWFRTSEGNVNPAFLDRDASVSVFRARFHDERDGIIAQADRVLSGTYQLLGHAELDFGTPVPDWHFEPIAGTRSPRSHWSRISETDATETGDKKIVWELNRHQYFSLLGRAYWLTGDEKYAVAFVSHIEDWIEKNPPKMGVNWMSGLEIAYRSISWIRALYFFRDSSALGPDPFLKILKCLYLNARHLLRNLSTYSSPNTHLTGEALGLYQIGTFLNGIEGSRGWKETGYEILIEALGYQVRDDGGYVEQATQYHRYTADIYLSLYIQRSAERKPIDPIHQESLRKMLEFLAHLTQPNGETPLIGDDDGGRLHFFDDRGFADFRSTLALGAAILNDGRLKSVAGEASSEILWLTGPDGLKAFDMVQPCAFEETAVGFEDTGWYVIRDSWGPESNFVVVDCGEHGFINCGHAHADALSFVLSVGGRPVFVDSGTCTYTADPAMRDYFRSSTAHNCLTVNGQSSSVPDGPFSWKSTARSRVLEWRTEGEKTFLRGSHDGYERFGSKYERVFEFVRHHGVQIRDKIETSSRSDFEITFVLAPDIDVEVVAETRAVLRADNGKRNVLTIDTSVVEGSPGAFHGWRTEPSRISPRYGQVVETTKLIFSLTRDHDFEVVSTCVFAHSV